MWFIVCFTNNLIITYAYTKNHVDQGGLLVDVGCGDVPCLEQLFGTAVRGCKYVLVASPSAYCVGTDPDSVQLKGGIRCQHHVPPTVDRSARGPVLAAEVEPGA